ncbi:MAG: polysaccharide deacetylase family protein [Vicinamibacterales bacterium]
MRSLWLMYHDVYGEAPRVGVPASASAYHVSRAAFATHLAAIGRAGHRVVTVGDFLANRAAGGDSVVLTFDDGWIGGFEIAVPMLAEYGWRATFYVTRDFVDRANFCGRATLRAADAAGMEIGVHGVTHRMLSSCSPAQIVAEFRDCRDYLESLLGRPVVHGSIPGGDFTPAVAAAAGEAGLSSLANSRPGVNGAATPRFDLRRLAVRASTGAADLDRFCRFEVRRERVRWSLLQMPRAVLGMRNYSRLRRRLLLQGPGASQVFDP